MIIIKRYLFTKSNMVFVAVVLVLLGVIGYNYHLLLDAEKKQDSLKSELKVWQRKVDKVIAKSNTVVYLPKSGDINLSDSQVESVQFLTDFFSRITTFSNSTAYATNYRMVKKHVDDSSFFENFMNSPTSDDGKDVVKMQNLYMKNEQVVVLVTGEDTYQVFVTYVPYHASSDLYQESKLYTVTRVFDVQGSNDKFTKMSLNNNFATDGLRIKVSDLN